MAIRVLITDDHGVVRQGLRMFLSLDPDIEVVGEAENGEEAELRQRLKAPANNLAQDLYVANELKTGRVMVKDEDVCLHCGLCAERCPTGAWDMKKFFLEMAQAGETCRSRA